MNNSCNSIYHTIGKNDTLGEISNKYNVTIGSILKLNNVDKLDITIGKRIRVK
ncbi:MAG: LysM peptidoglycan-binding domain-containing protein [Clostridiales bacterium]|nr:LysM peptidoglycan-binding domain-containing protein [Clostridiales bacterium]